MDSTLKPPNSIRDSPHLRTPCRRSVPLGAAFPSAQCSRTPCRRDGTLGAAPRATARSPLEVLGTYYFYYYYYYYYCYYNYYYCYYYCYYYFYYY